MAESNGEEQEISDSNQTVETKERGCFNFLAKKEGKTEHDAVMEENRKEDLTRLHSQSSSSIDEEFEGERKKNKLTLDHDNKNGEDVNDPIEVVDVDDKKGSFLDNIKAHIPGHHEKTEEEDPIGEVKHETNGNELQENETKEKKGILEKIKEKLHKKNEGELEDCKKEN